MRFISTKVHGMMDYMTGLLLILAPWIFNFATGGPAQWIPVIVGVAILGLSLMTDYELGVTRQIAVPTHLTIDVVTGLFLALSPWIFGFSELVYLPHLIIGMLEVGAGLMTHRVTGYKTTSPV